MQICILFFNSIKLVLITQYSLFICLSLKCIKNVFWIATAYYWGKERKKKKKTYELESLFVHSVFWLSQRTYCPHISYSYLNYSYLFFYTFNFVMLFIGNSFHIFMFIFIFFYFCQICEWVYKYMNNTTHENWWLRLSLTFIPNVFIFFSYFQAFPYSTTKKKRYCCYSNNKERWKFEDDNGYPQKI